MDINELSPILSWRVQWGMLDCKRFLRHSAVILWREHEELREIILYHPIS